MADDGAAESSPKPSLPTDATTPSAGRASEGDVTGLASQKTVEEIIAETHGSRVCGCRDILVIVSVLVFVAGFGYLLKTQEEQLADVASFIEDLGFGGRVIFFLLYIFVGLPMGYNWSTLTALVGWAYGWIGLLDVTVGTLGSSLLNYYGDRFCFKAWLERKISRMSEGKQAYFQAAKIVIEGGYAGFAMQILMRLGPLPFGITNAFLGAMCQIHPALYLASTLVGSIPGMLTMINLGVVVRRLGSFEAAAESPSGRVNLIVQVCMLICSIVGTIVFGRVLTVCVLPKLIARDEVRRSQRASQQKYRAEQANLAFTSPSVGQAAGAPGAQARRPPEADAESPIIKPLAPVTFGQGSPRPPATDPCAIQDPLSPASARQRPP